MSWETFEFQGRPVRLAVVRTPEGVWIGWPGGTRLFQRPRSGAGRPATVDREIRAPMTGRIVRVAAKAGAAVKAGDVLVVLEAMKMEYRLGAPRDGTIARVNCTEGERVDVGRALVELAP